MTRLSRRSLLVAAPALGLLAPSIGRAELKFDLRGGQFKPIPIAITDFAGDPQLGALVAQVIANNLKRSGYFSVIEKSAFVEKTTNPDAVPAFENWKAIGAQALVTGRATRDGARAVAQFRLWDVFAGQQQTGQQYATDASNQRRIAHLISDAVWEAVLGEKGHFDSRVVFVDETGPKDKRRKRLAIMDQDGANVRFLTAGNDLVVTPRFSPTSQQITYMVFASDGSPRVVVHNLDANTREAVGNFTSMTFAPRFSPDGRRLVMSQQSAGAANLLSMDLGSRQVTKLTDAPAIDTAPSFSPDGAQIVFESDRGGSQQIYVMPAGGGGAKRISFGEGSYSTPVWSPKGDLIAFTKRKGGGFAIGTMRPDGSGERILTEGFHNEGPTWSPNGRFLMFFRDPGGNSGARIYMVDITGRVEVAVPTPSFGSDPSWGPLLR